MDRNSRQRFQLQSPSVALRKESVDRNVANGAQAALAGLSLSARRAWIEMPGNAVDLIPINGVALRKESVDRNTRIPESAFKELGRSPQGERG